MKCLPVVDEEILIHTWQLIKIFFASRDITMTS